MVIINKQLSNFLYLIRWIAAFLVVIDHMRTNYFVGISQIQHNTIITKVFFLLTFLGHNSVMVFFVLSGFFVGGWMLKNFRENMFSFKEYLIKRFVRLYIVLIPALILAGIFAHLVFLRNGIICNTCDIKTFIGNIFYLQTIYVEPFAKNEPLWSLAYEAWYYLLFPLIIYIIFSKGSRRVISVLFLLLLFIILKPNLEILLYILIWLLGVFAFFYPKKILSFKISLFIFIVVFIGYRAITIKSSPIYLLEQGFLGDFVLVVSIMLLINSAKYSDLSLKFFKFNRAMADFSYTIYLVHVPILYFILTFFQKSNSFDLYHIFIFLMIVIIIYIYAYIVAFFTERYTKKITQYLLGRFK